MNYFNSTADTDEQLVRGALQGKREAFNTIIRNTEALVAGMIFRMIPAPADRPDLAQDVYLKVFNGLARFRFQSKLSTWIARITYNTCLHYLAKKKLVLSEPDEEQPDGSQDINTPEQILDQKELSLLLHDAVATLPPLYQTLIVLYHQQELSYRDIAIVTNMPEGTVKSYLHRARKGLKESVKNLYKP